METPCERLLPQLRYIAGTLCGHDANMRDDVVQEMAVTILEAQPGHLDTYYLKLARWRAQNYLSQFRRFPNTGLDENREA